MIERGMIQVLREQPHEVNVTTAGSQRHLKREESYNLLIVKTEPFIPYLFGRKITELES